MTNYGIPIYALASRVDSPPPLQHKDRISSLTQSHNSVQAVASKQRQVITMLVAASPFAPPIDHQTEHAPRRPSPLSTRSVNMPSEIARLPAAKDSTMSYFFNPSSASSLPFGMPSRQFSSLPVGDTTQPEPRLPEGGQASRPTDARTPFSRRPHKPVPSSLSSWVPGNRPATRQSAVEGSREKRRDMFLKKVKRDSDEQRWRARGGDEHIYRKVYVLERMRWKEYQERTARFLQPSVDEELELWMDGKLPPARSSFPPPARI